MKHGKNSSQGFTLIAALLIMVLLSGVVGLFYLVTNESRMGGNDLEANLAFYGAVNNPSSLNSSGVSSMASPLRRSSPRWKSTSTSPNR